MARKVITNTTIYFFVLFLAGFLYRAYAHLFLIPRWIVEEESFAYTVFELIKTGTTLRIGYQPVLFQYILYYIYLLTHIDPILLTQYSNAVIGALMIIPTYILLKNFLTKREALIATTICAFSETAVYRSSTFNSTETFALFLCLFALILYLKKNYVGFAALIIVSFFVHLLPPALMLAIVSIDLFFKGSKRSKIIVVLALVVTVVFLYSPLNPHQRILASIDPSVILSKFKLSNIFSLYSLTDLSFGISIYFGSILLLIIAVVSMLIFKTKNRQMWIYLFCVCSLFAFSWVVYISTLMAPTRMMFYFIIPLAYFASILINKLGSVSVGVITLILILAMIGSSLIGVTSVLYVKTSLTIDEYTFLETCKEINFKDIPFTQWWSDMPMKSALAMYTQNKKPSVVIDKTFFSNATQAAAYKNTTVTTIHTTTFTTVTTHTETYTNETIHITTHVNETVKVEKVPPLYIYVILSPRMESGALFFDYSQYRTTQDIEPVEDIWKNAVDWKLIEEYNDVKLYKWSPS